ncbi:MAG: type I-U CRISPR-associated protein Csb2 [Propionibacteriaceae bacterium]|nr:type I-U CRISPR-associated protein Csb2 [Propionibacteriaceae bacterium]
MGLQGILARFPLGVFRGHNPDGSIAPFPDTARLFSALLNAAGQGDSAVPSGTDTTPSSEALTALRWLENNPPDALHLPPLRRPDRDTEAYRDEGTLNQQGKVAKTLRHVSGTALGGPVAWLWADGIPDEIASTLDLLAADVSCLGEADSPVVLEVGEAEPTHHLDQKATPFSRGGTRVRSVTTGRLDALETAYRESRRMPRSESVKEKGEKSALHPIPNDGVTTLLYRVPAPETGLDEFAPWPQVAILPVRHGTPVTERTAVKWCVTLRSALLSHLGDEAPPVITGRYPDDVAKPANRVALQYLPAGHASHHGIEEPAFLVMLPRGIDPVDEEALLNRLKGIRSLRNDLGTQSLGPYTLVPGATFWPRNPNPTPTLWKPLTPLIPEVRAGDRRCGLSPWSPYDTLNLSLGLLMRDLLGEHIPRDPTAEDPKATWRHLADTVQGLDFTVQDLYQLKDSKASDFVHKAPAGMVIQPYRALLELAPSLSPTAIMAVGQSRHLGGGLLVPTFLSLGKESSLAFHS